MNWRSRKKPKRAFLPLKENSHRGELTTPSHWVFIRHFFVIFLKMSFHSCHLLATLKKIFLKLQ